MCSFCENIGDIEKYCAENPYPWDETIAIIKIGDGYKLYQQRGDSYYNFEMWIDYCPQCGKRLSSCNIKG